MNFKFKFNNYHVAHICLLSTIYILMNGDVPALTFFVVLAAISLVGFIVFAFEEAQTNLAKENYDPDMKSYVKDMAMRWGPVLLIGILSKTSLKLPFFLKLMGFIEGRIVAIYYVIYIVLLFYVSIKQCWAEKKFF